MRQVHKRFDPIYNDARQRIQTLGNFGCACVRGGLGLLALLGSRHFAIAAQYRQVLHLFHVPATSSECGCAAKRAFGSATTCRYTEPNPLGKATHGSSLPEAKDATGDFQGLGGLAQFRRSHSILAISNNLQGRRAACFGWHACTLAVHVTIGTRAA